MSPFAEIINGNLTNGSLHNENEEAYRANWVTTLSLARGHAYPDIAKEHVPENDINLLVEKTGMPKNIATLIVNALRKPSKAKLRVEADVVYDNETGHIGGPRHYENYRVVES